MRGVPWPLSRREVLHRFYRYIAFVSCGVICCEVGYNFTVLNTTHGCLTMIANNCSKIVRKYARGCRPKTFPKWPPWVHLHTRLKQQHILHAQSAYNAQSRTLCLGRTGAACCKLPKPQKSLPYTLKPPWPPWGLAHPGYLILELPKPGHLSWVTSSIHTTRVS